jgi:hypothetical protein
MKWMIVSLYGMIACGKVLLVHWRMIAHNSEMSFPLFKLLHPSPDFFQGHVFSILQIQPQKKVQIWLMSIRLSVYYLIRNKSHPRKG